MIVCDNDKLDGKRCNGAPDFIIEIVSPGNPEDDYVRKLYYYQKYGVREYWIVDPLKGRVLTYCFNGDNPDIGIYGLHDTVPVGIYGDLSIDFGEFSFLV